MKLRILAIRFDSSRWYVGRQNVKDRLTTELNMQIMFNPGLMVGSLRKLF